MGLLDWMNSSPQAQGGLLSSNAQMPTRADYLTNLGFALLQAGGPSNRPTGLGSAVGQAGLYANQAQQQAKTSALQNQLMGQQGQLLGTQIQQAQDWQKMWQPQSAVPPPIAQEQSLAGQAMTPPGVRPGPTPQAAAALNAPPPATAQTAGPPGVAPAIPPVQQSAAVQPTATGFSQQGVPQAMLPALRAMGPQQGAAFLGQLAAKNMERGQFIPENRTIDGKDIPGQTDRLSGKWAPLDPTLTKLTVNPSMSLPPQETAFQKQVGEDFGKLYSQMQTNTMTAGARLGKLDRLDQLLSKTYTGAGAETVQSASKALKAAADGMGIPTDAITERVGVAEAAQSIAGEMALQLRNPSGGAGMPGAMSDKDREFLQSMVPGLGQTEQGRKTILETQRRLIKREQDIAKMARDYRKKNGVFDDGFFTELQSWSDKHPLFGDMNIQTAPTGGASAPIPPAGTVPKVFKYNPATGQIE